MIGHLVVRLISVAIGFAAAVLVAALFLSLGYVRDVAGPIFEYHTGVEADGLLVPIIGIAATPVLAANVLAPSALAIAIAELMRWRGLIANALAGGMVALFAGWRAFGLEPDQALEQGVVLVLLATGFLAGCVYWAIAGRSAGKWLD